MSIESLTSPTSHGLLKTKEAADYIGCSEATIKRAVQKGDLPAYHAGTDGRTNYYRVEDLDGLFTSAMTDEQRLDVLIKSIVDKAPALTEAQKERLAGLLDSGDAS